MDTPWYYAPLFGAAFLFCLMCIGVVADAASGGLNDKKSLLVPIVAAIGGGAGGLCYSTVGARLARIRIVGRYVAGMLVVGVYLGALLFSAWWLDPASMEEFLSTPLISLISVLVAIGGFGVVIGRKWYGRVQSHGSKVSDAA